MGGAAEHRPTRCPSAPPRTRGAGHGGDGTSTAHSVAGPLPRRRVRYFSTSAAMTASSRPAIADTRSGLGRSRPRGRASQLLDLGSRDGGVPSVSAVVINSRSTTHVPMGFFPWSGRPGDPRDIDLTSWPPDVPNLGCAIATAGIELRSGATRPPHRRRVRVLLVGLDGAGCGRSDLIASRDPQRTSWQHRRLSVPATR